MLDAHGQRGVRDLLEALLLDVGELGARHALLLADAGWCCAAATRARSARVPLAGRIRGSGVLADPCYGTVRPGSSLRSAHQSAISEVFPRDYESGSASAPCFSAVTRCSGCRLGGMATH